ncbi:hypothetical protein NYR54_04930 [Chelativorans sp. SCAU2101]|uniref:Uncharacterized protein n=1 Tax=Chelativorans petroleitrophicus TaxID=2975484 RepID=A0A9X2X8K0_9HYPH|nr:hypothetical protein [Chelativorans petroleitrophicus]MCT8989640.1 hypothetical protein [Chelativorans petroleitrophicus]
MNPHPEPRRRPGRPPRGGSPEAAAADRQRRREEYARLRASLDLSPAELAALLGLSVNTIRRLPGWSDPALAPTDKALATMRRELARRTRERLEETRIRREIERDLLEAECRLHMLECGALYGEDEQNEQEAA